jgi:hypothetical protein
MSRGHGHQKKRKAQDERGFQRLRDQREGKARRLRQERERLREAVE